jgi:3-hydroxyisobutyrate dehydrogenase
MKKIGWIGTGVMGLSMAGHIQAAGYDLSVYNRTKASASSLIKKGAVWCDSPAAVAGSSEMVFTMVGLPSDVEQVYMGEKGIFSTSKPPNIVIDMTTSQPSLAQTIASISEEKGIESLDAPVSGGDIGAKEAKLAIMIGGKKETFEKVLPFFQLMGENIAYMGRAGAGQNTKMCNQIIIAGNMIGVCESLLYAVKVGLDQQAVIDIVSKGAAGSWTIQNLGPRIVKEDFDTGFFVKHFIKDMGIALQEAASVGLSLPGLSLVHQLYIALKAQGHELSKTQALMIALKRLNGLD